MSWNKPIALFKVYSAALIATVIFLPGLLALVTVVIYLAGLAGEGMATLKWSWLISVGTWLALSIPCSSLAKAKNCIPSSFGELQGRLTQLQAVIESLGDHRGTTDLRNAASDEINKQIHEIDEELKRPGLPWVLARGYVNVWNRMYRAEEALIEVEPQATVVGGALYDELRLQGSKIDNCEELLAKLRQAVTAIDSNAAQYLKPAPPGTKQLAIVTPSALAEGTVNSRYRELLMATGGTPPYSWKKSGGALPDGVELDQKTGALSGTPKTAKEHGQPFTVVVTDKVGLMMEKQLTLIIKDTAGKSAPPTKDTTLEPMARAVLRVVRRSINEYRGNSWNGLIVARNRLLGTMLATTLTAYALLVIAIICKAPKGAIAAASVFYFVGATVGLFSRLRAQSKADTAVEDYGLSAARLVTIPVFSGLAAIAGIVLVATAPYVIPVFGPTTEAPAPAVTAPAAAMSPQVTASAEGPGLMPEAKRTLAIITPLPEGIVNLPYKQALQPSGGTPPFSWTVSGEMPDGLVLDPKRGLLTGTPTTAGRANLVLQVTDGAGANDKKEFGLTIKPASSGGPPSLADVFNLHKYLLALLIAAVFGLTPELLLDGLLKQTEKLKGNLKSSEATQEEAKQT